MLCARLCQNSFFQSANATSSTYKYLIDIVYKKSNTGKLLSRKI